MKFRKQHPVGKYVLDFYCLTEKLIIEVDGSIHEDPEQQALDRERTQRLSQEGNRLLRFSNTSVIEDLPAVLDQIYSFLSQHPIHNLRDHEPALASPHRAPVRDGSQAVS